MMGFLYPYPYGFGMVAVFFVRGKKFFLRLLLCGLVFLIGSVHAQIQYYEGDYTTYIKECPVPSNILRGTNTSQKTEWDAYCVNGSGPYCDYDAFFPMVGGVRLPNPYPGTTKENNPYGIARWRGQCTYNALTSGQKKNPSCVTTTRGKKLLTLIASNVCARPSNLAGTDFVSVASPTNTTATIVTIQNEKSIINTLGNSYATKPDKSNIPALLYRLKSVYDKQFKKSHAVTTQTAVAPKVEPKPTIVDQPVTEQAQGDPVHLEDGSFRYTDTVLSYPMQGQNFDLVLSYNNRVEYRGSQLGVNRDHNRNQMIIQDDSGVRYTDGSLHQFPFASQGENTYWSKVLDITLTYNPETGVRTMIDSYGSIRRFATILGAGIFHLTDYSPLPGSTYTLLYDNEANLRAVRDPRGGDVIFDYNPQTQLLEKVTLPNGRYATFGRFTDPDDNRGDWNDLGSVSIFSQTETKTISYTYTKNQSNPDLNHNLVDLIDAKGVTYVRNIYSADDRVIQQNYGNGTLYYNYTVVDGLVTQTRARNRKGELTIRHFDAQGNPVTMQAEGYPAHQMTYDTDGQLLTEKLLDGTMLVYAYDPKGNVVSMTMQSGAKKTTDTFAYDANSRVLTHTARNGITTNYTYTADGLVATKAVQPTDGSKPGLTRSYQYTSRRLVSQITMPDGQVVSFGYDDKDQLVSSTRSAGSENQTTTLVRDTFGNVTKITDPEGNIFASTYTKRDQLQSSLTPEGVTNAYRYDATNNLIETMMKRHDGTFAWMKMDYDIVDDLVRVRASIEPTATQSQSRTYDPNQHISTATNAKGTVWSYTYDVYQRPIAAQTTISTTDGVVQTVRVRYTYDLAGNLTKILDPKNRETLMTYNRRGQIETMTNPEKTVTTVIYDDLYRPIRVTQIDKEGKIWTDSRMMYDAWGDIISQSRHDVLNSGKVLTQTTTYDNLRRPIEMTDHRGAKTTMTYDAFGRRESVISPTGVMKLWQYDRRNLVVSDSTITAEDQILTDYYTYDRDGRMIQTTNHVGYTRSLAYNVRNQLTTITDAEGNKTTYTYDDLGRRLTETKNDGKQAITTRYQYDANGNLIALIDANGNETRYTYDGLDRQMTNSLPDGSQTKYRYDGVSNIISSRDPNGSLVTNRYDVMDRLVARSIDLGSGVGGVTGERYRYNPLGALMGGTDTQGNLIKFSYDGLMNLVSETTNAQTVQYQYDAINDQIGLTYPSGKSFRMQYDIIQRLVGMDDITHNPSQPGIISPIIKNYRDSMNLVGTEQGNGTTTSYRYDALMRLKELHHLDFKTPAPMDQIDYRFVYDRENHLVHNGQDTRYYDDTYQTTNVQYNNGKLVTRQNGNYNKGGYSNFDGELYFGTNPDLGIENNQFLQTPNMREQHYQYDAMGNRQTEANAVPGVSVGNDIHIASNCKPGGSVGHTNNLEQQYDSKFYEESCPLTDQDAIIGGSAGGKGKPSTKPNDAYSGYLDQTGSSGDLYGSLIREVGLMAKGGGGGGGGGGNNGNGGNGGGKGGENGKGSSTNKAGIDAVKQNGNTNYNGNGADRGLKLGRYKDRIKNGAPKPGDPSSSSPNSSYVGGNPDLYTGTIPQKSGDIVYRENNLNQYESVTKGNLSGVAITFDANGNMTSNEKFLFQYDYRNRMIRAEAKPEAGEYLVVSFTYDVLGRRMTKWVDRKSNVGRFIKYVYAGHNAVQEEWFYNIGEGREQLKEYVYNPQGVDQLLKVYIAKQGKQEQQRFYTDHQGSVIAIADEYGKIIESYRYDAWGNMILGYQSNSIKMNLSPSAKNAQTNTANGSKSWITNSRLYTSRERDEEIELYYYRARHYEPRIGRFIQRDPIGYYDDTNLYRYVGNSSMNYTDPWGLERYILRGKDDKDVTDQVVAIFNQYRLLEAEHANAVAMMCGISEADCVFAKQARNTAFSYETLLGKSNLKVNGTLMKEIAAGSEPYVSMGVKRDSYYFMINGEKIYAATFGNVLFSYRGYYAGYEYQELESKAMSVTEFYKSGASENERVDRPYYQYGYSLATNTAGRSITREELMSGLYDMTLVFHGKK